jgi:RND family efflux transporter MFP subunit
MMSPKKYRSNYYEHTTLFFVAAILAVLVLFLLACSKQQEETVAQKVIRPVKTMTVKAAEEISGMTLPAKVRASKRVDLAFKRVGGRLIELPVTGREGQQVEKGALLARIDPKDFETQLRNAQGQLNEAQAGLKLAKKEYDRVLNIKKKDPGAISAADIDRKREAVGQMEGRIRSLNATVDDAKNKLSYTRLEAPFTGLIARRLVDNFQTVKPEQPIVSLQDVSNVELLVDVPENVVAYARAQGEGAITAVAEFPTAPGKEYPLDFKEVATDADPATQTYQVVFQMPQPEGINVLPGMTATVIVSSSGTGAATPERQIRIPAIAVVADPQGKNYVWVVDEKEMSVKKQEVQVGRVVGSENIDILEGLEGGETIVVAGVLKLEDGLKVKLWDEQQ